MKKTVNYYMLPDINTILKPRPKKYRNLVKHIQRDLIFFDSDTTSLTEKDLFNDLSSSRGTSCFLGVFSIKGIEFVLKKFGFYDHLRSIGLPKPKIILDTSDSFKHRIQVTHKAKNKNLVIGEIVMRRSNFRTEPQGEKHYPPADLLVLEWFLLQNPLKKFSRRRPQLPGQDYPGLGFASTIFEIFYWMAKRLKADGVVLVPNYLHTGIFYGRRFLFINPKKQGILSAIDKIRNPNNTLIQLSWACSEGQLIDRKSNSVFLWQPSPMIMPTSRTAKQYFSTEHFLDKVKQSEKSVDLKINKGYKKRFNSNWKGI